MTPKGSAKKLPLRAGGPAARIAVIPGDGIGREVTPVSVDVIRSVVAPTKRAIEFVEFDWSADRYLRDGVSLPPGAVEMLRGEFDAILFGALGDPRVPSNQHAADILLGLRFQLDLFVNARPVELLHTRLLRSPAARKKIFASWFSGKIRKASMSAWAAFSRREPPTKSPSKKTLTLGRASSASSATPSTTLAPMASGASA